MAECNQLTAAIRLPQLLSRIHQCRVVMVGATAFRLKAAQRLGAIATFDITQSPASGLDTFRRAHSLDGATLPSVSFEASGHPAAVSESIHSVGTGGTVVLVGLTAGVPASLDVDHIVLVRLIIFLLSAALCQCTHMHTHYSCTLVHYHK